jgi:hypothetical protein
VVVAMQADDEDVAVASLTGTPAEQSEGKLQDIAEAEKK